MQDDLIARLRAGICEDKCRAMLATSGCTCAAAADRIEELEGAIADPVAVHLNMLRGSIAKPSIANIVHLYGAETLAAALDANKKAPATGARAK